MKENKTIHIGLSGSSGRMGQSIIDLVQQTEDLSIQCIYNDKSPLAQWDASQLDVVIDFSSPSAFIPVVNWCTKYKKPLVSGTTGLTQKEFEILKHASKTIALLWSPNMSLGIACIQKWLKNLHSDIKKWDIQIQDIHHRLKKDAPSGTALLLQETLNQQGISSPQPLSIRGGEVHGHHKILFMGQDEIISIEHIAQNRKIFSKGALLAARWILHQNPGLYEIQNCL